MKNTNYKIQFLPSRSPESLSAYFIFIDIAVFNVTRETIPAFEIKKN